MESFADHLAAIRILIDSDLEHEGREALADFAVLGGRRWALGTRCFAAQSTAINQGYISATTLAQALQKYGKLEEALSFAKQGYESHIGSAGDPRPIAQVQGHACAGRILCQLSRAEEAAIEFEAAVASAMPPVACTRIALLEALALRDYVQNAIRHPEFEWDLLALQKRFNAAVNLLPATVEDINSMLL